MNPDFLKLTPDERETRVTALLLGELPPADAAVVRQAIEKDPRLARVYERLKQTIGLVREAVARPENPKSAQPTPLRLSAERRQKLLERFRGVVSRPTSPAPSAARRLDWSWYFPMTLAAALVAMLALSGLVMDFGWRTLAKSKSIHAKYSSNGAKGHFNLEPASSGQISQEVPSITDEVTQLADAEKSSRAWYFAAGNREKFGQNREAIPEIRQRGETVIDSPVPALSLTPETATPQAAAERFPKRDSSAKGVAQSPGQPGQAARGLWGDGMGGGMGGGMMSGMGGRGGMGGYGDGDSAVGADTSGVALGYKAKPLINGRSSVELNVLAESDGKPSSSAVPSRRLNLGREVQTQPAPTVSDQAVAGTTGKPSDSLKVAAVKDNQPVALDVKLPAPAFVGTPTDLGTASWERKKEAGELRLASKAPAPQASPAAPVATQPAVPPPISRPAAARGFGSGLAGADKAKSSELARQRPMEERAGRSIRAGKPVSSNADGILNDNFDFDGTLSSRADSYAAAPTQPPQPSHFYAYSLGDAPQLGVLFNRTQPRDALVTNRIMEEHEAAQKLQVTESLARSTVEGVAAGDFVVKTTAPPPEPQPEVQTAENPFSTFSLNVTDVSFKLAASSLEKGVMPDPATVRSEEFINAFNYRDPAPAPGLAVGFNWERARYPFAHKRDVVRFALQTAARGREAGLPMHLVLLLDNSGSMERADRVSIIREALKVLAAQLQPQDRISVVAFARTARLWVDALAGDQANELVERVGNLTPEGGTNLEDALNLAYQTAVRHFLNPGINRVVLLTDGAANLGNVDPPALQQKVEQHRKQGIALDCFGIGWEGYNDDLLEVLARHGDGRYGFVNAPEEVTTEFANQLAGALQVAAADVKVQVEFNPRRVIAHRQIGYAKHQLTKEQFRDNTVDAAELGAAESGNALYLIEVNPRGTGPIGMLRVRYKVPSTGLYQEQEWPLAYTGSSVSFEQASPALRLAVAASAFSEWLAGSPFAGEVTPDRLLSCLGNAPAAFNLDPRPKKLEWMIRQAGSIAGK